MVKKTFANVAVCCFFSRRIVFAIVGLLIVLAVDDDNNNNNSLCLAFSVPSTANNRGSRTQQKLLSSTTLLRSSTRRELIGVAKPSNTNAKTLRCRVSLQSTQQKETTTTSDTDSYLPEKEKLLRDFKKDLEQLAIVRPNLPSADVSAPLTIISAGSSYTRLWTPNTWNIHSGPPLRRYIRHLWKWHSSTTARRILPIVLLSTAWAATLCMAHHYSSSSPAAAAAGMSKMLKSSILQKAVKVIGPSSVLSSLSAPLALLLTLRANASMSRLVEARLLWGQLVLHARALASLVKVHLFEDAPAASVLLARHLAALGWTVKSNLRGESEEYEFEVLKTIIGCGKDDDEDNEDYQWLKAQPKRTVALTSRIRQLVAGAIEQRMWSSSSSTANQYRYATSIQLLLEERIGAIEQSIGGCERLNSSPIPPTYTRHLSRVLSLWIVLTPMSLISMGLSTLGVCLATTVATYVLVGIDEVGMEIENAFQLLPLQQLSAAIQNGVRDQMIPERGEMPPVPV